MVVGWEVGQPLPDDAGQAIIGGASTLGGIFGGPAGATLAGALATGAVGIFGAKRHADARAAEAKRDGERTGWDEAVLAGNLRPAVPANGSSSAGGAAA